jgi:hypothetical protein
MACEGRAHAASNDRIADDLRLAADLEGRDPAKVDRSKLVTEHDRILGLSGNSGGNGNLSGVPWGTGRNRTHGREAASVKRLVRNDERSAEAGLLVTDRGIEIDDDDRPAEAIGHSGHVSASRKTCSISRISA